jgi:DNA-binding response OmpR family regulator
MPEEPKKILIVEDDQFIRELYERQLKLAGFNVESTFSGKSALELLDKNFYDLLMLDLNVPDVSGFQILRHLKKEHPKPMDVLVVSNVSDDKMIDEAMNLGAQGFIIKSTYTPSQVVKEVKSILS